MAAEGNNLIVDEVMIGEAQGGGPIARCCHGSMFVSWASSRHLTWSKRGSVRVEIGSSGLARWQYDRVHHNIIYDLEIDTTATTPMENAERIRDAFGL